MDGMMGMGVRMGLMGMPMRRLHVVPMAVIMPARRVVRMGMDNWIGRAHEWRSSDVFAIIRTKPVNAV